MSDPPAEVGLTAGATVAHYRIVRRLGAGGMGEVWLAHDQTLNRQVALKFPAVALLGDPDTRHRLLREARAAAALRHPAVCRVFELGQVEGRDFIAMEYLEGETLGDRLARGPVPPRQALSWGAAIAAALEEAHDKGIVHRDLKPGNVVVTPQGEVKVMDFGLARALPGRGGQADEATMTAGLTAAGMAVGTPGYMAPEQLRGQEVDERADLWALGCVLYQLLTGERAFPGPSVAEAAGATLNLEPDWERLPAATPLEARRLLARCLRKDPGQRLRHAGDARLMLEEALRDEPAPGLAAAAAPTGRPGWRQRAGWLAAGLGLGLVAALAVAWASRSTPSEDPAAARPVRFELPPPEGGSFVLSLAEAVSLAVSPDGGRIAFVAVGAETRSPQIWLRALDELAARPVPGTEGASSVFWSPDGRSLGFFSAGRLRRVGLAGEAPVVLCETPSGLGLAGSWGGDAIVFVTVFGERIYRVSPDGGDAVELLVPDLDRGEAKVQWPWFLPDGKRFLYLATRSDRSAELRLADLRGESWPVGPIGSRVEVVDPGLVVSVREGALIAQRFDAERGELAGTPVALATQVRNFETTRGAGFATSRTGTLVYGADYDRHRLGWFDTSGQHLGGVGEPYTGMSVAIAPNARRAVIDRMRPDIGTWDLWMLDLVRGVESRLTSDRATESSGRWLPDGASIVHQSSRAFPPLLVRLDLATGREEDLLSVPGAFLVPAAVTPDARELLFLQRPLTGGFELWRLPLAGGGAPSRLLRPGLNVSGAVLSPDGRLLAYVAAESGRAEAYVRPLLGPAEAVRVSVDGARLVRFAPGGDGLYFTTPDRRLMVAPIAAGPELTVGAPRLQFPLPALGWTAFDVAPDGRFLALVQELDSSQAPLTVVTHAVAAGRGEVRRPAAEGGAVE
ncbi:MAG TPA: protein kinase [Thermoanaerobaculia bacterium]|nr:protein kinase [Thermoanaerobaculia bacterium]